MGVRARFNRSLLIAISLGMALVPGQSYSGILTDISKSITPEDLLGSAVLDCAENDLEEGLQKCKDREFVRLVLKKYSILKGHNCASALINLRLKVSEWHYYPLLQEKIAELIPLENQRPTIDLTLTESKENNVPESVGIAGGTGPLSDSDLFSKVVALLQPISKIDWTRFAINLYSSPPPRELIESVSRIFYIERMADFTSRGHNRYYLASNTAHINLRMFRWTIYATSGIRLRMTPGNDTVVDLAEYVSNAVAKPSNDQPPEVLILSSLQSYDSQLYPGYLNTKGLEGKEHEKRPVETVGDASNQVPHSATQIPNKPIEHGHYFTVGNHSRAELLQDYIDIAKSGNIEEAGQRISEFILDELHLIHQKGGHVNRIILGCTELPMALKGDLLKTLKNEIRFYYNDQVEFFDTEELFSQKIASDVESLNGVF